MSGTMDHQAFLQRLLDTLNAWRALKNVDCTSFEISPPDPDAVKDFSAKYPGVLAPDLSSFYAKTCGGANIQLTISVPGGKSAKLKSPIADGMDEVEDVWVGFQLASLNEAATWQADMLDIVDSIAGRHITPSQTKTARNILSKAIPLAVMSDSSFILCANSRGKFTPGIYCLDYGCLGEPKKALKYTDSFNEWLLFLEQSLYLSPDFSLMEWFREEDGLRINAALIDELAKVLKLPARKPRIIPDRGKAETSRRGISKRKKRAKD